MGSFTELCLAFTFSRQTPVEVLGAFGQWRTGEGAPELPTLQESLGDDPFDADIYLGDLVGDDPMESLSLVQQAALWEYLQNWNDNAYFPGAGGTVLRWSPYGHYWTLTIRTMPKESGVSVQSMVVPLGEWATDGSPEHPWFAGYILDEHRPRPALLWSIGGAPFQVEEPFDVG